jgi:DNA-directed RNA polymerase subunit RPC12/RpoP
MKYCYHCGHTTEGKPLFCNSCGRTYDVKLCPKLHVNPRLANACSSCGSRLLSMPHPKVPVHWRVAQWVVQVVSAIVLVCLSYPPVREAVVEISVIHRATDPTMFWVLGISFLWSVWWILRDYMRSLVRQMVSSASS